MLSEKHALKSVDRVDVTGDIQSGALTLHSSERTVSARLTRAQLGALARQLWTLLSGCIRSDDGPRHPDAPVPVERVNMIVGKSGNLVVLEFHLGELRLPFVLSADVLREMCESLPESSGAKCH